MSNSPVCLKCQSDLKPAARGTIDDRTGSFGIGIVVGYIGASLTKMDLSLINIVALTFGTLAITWMLALLSTWNGRRRIAANCAQHSNEPIA
ncbi:hypothetical protein [Nocardia tengchongensis]|uniref:hypothetical protein n=1 Tax=Nocardia tengchongensis TaxID=2055889 RepID=UPI00364C49DD